MSEVRKILRSCLLTLIENFFAVSQSQTTVFNLLRGIVGWALLHYSPVRLCIPLC